MTAERPRVVVTGAAGFIGRHVVARFVRGGWDVTGVVRSAPISENPRSDVVYIARDLERTASMMDIFRPGDVLVHLAARVHQMHDRSTDLDATYRQANVLPVRMLCRSAAEAGIGQFIFLSSAKVYGESRAATFTLADAPAPLDPYARSKHEAEDVISAAARGGAFTWTVLRPPFVYGAGGRGNFPRLVTLAKLASYVPLPLAGVRNQRSIIFVENLADAVFECARQPAAGNRFFLPTDEERVSTPRLLFAIAKHQGTRARLFALPTSVLRAAARLVGRAEELRRLTEDFTLDGSTIRNDLHWTPPFQLSEALRRSLSPAHEEFHHSTDG